jgi:hypothetical protein
MLALIILGKELITLNNVNVYLQPSIEELHVLWRGVKAFDAYSGARFNLNVMCIWSTHNFIAYGLSYVVLLKAM